MGASMAETLTVVLPTMMGGPRAPYAHRTGRTGAGAHGPAAAVPWRSSSQRRRRPSGPEAARCPLAFYQSGMALEIEFPEAKTTKWSRGSTVPVGFLSIWHGGGDRVPRGEDDQVVPRQHGARWLFINLAWRW